MIEGLAEYIHNSSHKFGIGTKKKKYIFIWHSEHSKRYLFIREDSARRLVEIVSKAATFIENIFPNRDDTNKDLYLYKIEEQYGISTSQQPLVESQEVIPLPILNSGNKWEWAPTYYRLWEQWSSIACLIYLNLVGAMILSFNLFQIIGAIILNCVGMVI